MRWADEFVLVRIIAQVLYPELVLAQDFWFAVMMGILVEGIVFDVPAYLVLFQVGIVFFAL
jgi:hypothetical protein